MLARSREGSQGQTCLSISFARKEIVLPVFLRGQPRGLMGSRRSFFLGDGGFSPQAYRFTGHELRVKRSIHDNACLLQEINLAGMVGVEGIVVPETAVVRVDARDSCLNDRITAC